MAKIGRNTYNQWESGVGRPSLDQAKRLRKAFKYTLDWIYEGDRSGLPLQLATKIAEIEPQEARQAAGRSGRAA
jgi:transcriptional regulator with XRE-family HTH domain